MTRDTIEDRETAALRAARLAYTRASDQFKDCVAEYQASVRRSEADPANRQLRSARATLYERCAAAERRKNMLKARYHEAEAAERGRGSDE